MKRRVFLGGMGALLAAGAGVPISRNWPEDGWRNPCANPVPSPESLSHPLLRAALDGLDFSRVWDMHAHLTGTGDGGSGIWVNPRMDSLSHPVEYVQKAFYLNASCVAADARSQDAGYVRRLAGLADGLPAGFKAVLLAFERFYRPDGKALDELTQFRVPNRYAAAVAASRPERFAWAASVHPYRPDWREELDFCLAQGAKAVKWLPASMGMDPADRRCEPFYAYLADHGLPLISHAGEEQAAPGADLQDYGNPLRLRRALAQGVRVVVAHCASLGRGIDLDKGVNGPTVENFSLFARMMDEPGYSDRLFGDVSAVTQINRMGCLKTLLERTDWHSRLLNGSDYPLPGILPLFSLRHLVAAGVLDAGAAPVLSGIRRHNALLFDFSLKRSLAWQGRSFAPVVFETRPFFERRHA